MKVLCTGNKISMHFCKSSKEKFYFSCHLLLRARRTITFQEKGCAITSVTNFVIFSNQIDINFCDQQLAISKDFSIGKLTSKNSKLATLKGRRPDFPKRELCRDLDGNKY